MTKNTFQKYSGYKDSGEYWLGEIPDYWEAKKLKHLFSEKKITHNPNLGCGAISFGEVITKDDDKIPESTKASYQEVLEGEFLVNPLNLNYDLKSLRIALSKINVVVSSGYIVLKDLGQINRQYYKYLLHRYDVAYMKLLGSGVRQTINFNHISNSLLAYPPLNEQTAIANFLDDKTAKIDQAIAQKEQLIALLKERKQIIIQNAVTKGLDPNVKMKDSGVEWIGEIPEHWEVKRLKNLTNYFKGFAFKSQDFIEEKGLPIVKASNIKNWEIKNVKSFIDYSNQREEFSRFKLSTGNIIISTVGSKPHIKESAVGQLAFVKEGFNNAYLNQNTVCFRANIKIEKSFLKYVFVSKYMRDSFDRISLWIANQAYLEVDSIREQIVPLPAIKEQKVITDFIEKKSFRINNTIALQQTQIEKLKEYKATLIDSAVTGKIKVC
ncbi:restriction endonuclease subunit S [Tenacibaculum sp. SZ-18]|uniref:restriction endonuclease subunit S n=1 Tax=Tenacibaculum sp. SZ-18 TaxID=754423 RepID=UPI0018E22FBE|nr:restriction endonuclease subunit S [Tenacibaculum sp. SZ-18]